MWESITQLEEQSNENSVIKENFTDRENAIIDEVTDWYISREIDKSFCFPNVMKVSENKILKKFIQILLNKVEEKLNREDQNQQEIFLHVKSEDGKIRYFRGNRIDSIDGNFWALRRNPDKVPSLLDLGFNKNYSNIILNDGMKSGLILIIGETGNGKSTTCSSIVKEFCAKGKYALTIEDPPEMPLNGFLGNGVCIQTEVEHGDFGESIRKAMRSYPVANGSILYVGEGAWNFYVVLVKNFC